MGRDEVTDECEDGHDNICENCQQLLSKESSSTGYLTLSHRHDVRARDFCNGNTAVGLVCNIQVDMVRSDTSGNSELQLLGLAKTLGSQITGMETAAKIRHQSETEV